MAQAAWHSVEADELLKHFETSVQGLASDIAQQRLLELGPNLIPETHRRSLLVMLLGQFTDFMILVLLAAALISGFIGDLQDTIAILVIVLLNAIIGTVQEYRAERAVAALRAMATPDAMVLRDGKAQTILANDLVPGDIIMLETGSLVPADCRLFEVEELQLDESALTGESHGAEKQTEIITESDVPLGDRFNLAFKSSMVTRGRGRGVVVATGLATEMGQIAELLRSEKSQNPFAETPHPVWSLSGAGGTGHLCTGVCCRYFTGPAFIINVSHRRQSGGGRYTRSFACGGHRIAGLWCAQTGSAQCAGA